MSIPYFSLHCHTEYSNIRLLDSLNKTEELIDYAKELGLSAVAITDHDVLSAHVRAIKYLKKKRKEEKKHNENSWANFRVVLGNEIYLTRDGLNSENFERGEDRFYHFILLAKDAEGHKQLREISTRAWKRSYMRVMRRVPTYYRDLEEIVGANPGHLIASTACLGSKYSQLLLEHHEYRLMDPDRSDRALEDYKELVRWGVRVFGVENFFLEKQPSLNKEQWIANKLVEELHEELGVRTVITSDVHYLRKEDRPIHRAFLNAKQGDREVDDFYASTYLMDHQEIEEYFTLADEKYGTTSKKISTKEIVARDLQNTLDYVLSQIEEYDLAHTPIIPHAEIHWGRVAKATPIDSKYEFINKFITSKYEQDQFFIARVFHELQVKYTKEYLAEHHEKYYNRIETECRVYWRISEKLEQRMSAYPLLIGEICDLIWSKGNSIMGPSRGSALGFLTNYLLDITQIDPLQADMDIPYWRFLTEERPDMPDVDLDCEGRKREQIMEALREQYGRNRVVNVATFKTEKPKSAIQTAARGLGLSDDDALYLSSMVKSERGFLWSLHDCFYGNPEEGRAPIAQFRDEMQNNYPELWQVAQRIEGLISGYGIHAAGILIANEDFTEHNALMRAPNSSLITQFELKDTEYMGGVKIDLLSIEGADKIGVTLELLLEYGKIEKKPTLKETYLSVLNPNDRTIVDYTSPELWDLAGDGKVMSLFQFDTPVGGDAIRRVRPRNIVELATINSLMRLMASDGEMPLDTYIRYKETPGLWERDMRNYGLNDSEISIMKEYLADSYGVAESQELMMRMVMDERIAGFDIIESNQLRKSVSKKNAEDFLELERLFYKKGKKLGTSNALLSYVWEVQILRQKGYSFSSNHTYAYSVIALQELNLVHRFSPLYWNVANLIVDSGSAISVGEDDELIIENSEFEDDEDDEEDEIAEDDPSLSKKKKVRNIDYGKIGTALGKIRSAGTVIALPNINKSSFTFAPDEERNAVLYGLKGIARLNEDKALEVIENRPYTSLSDFLSKIKLTKPQVVNLIKAGAFDEIEGKERFEIMREYIYSISDTKKNLNLQNMAMLIRMEMIPEELDFQRRLYNFNKYLKLSKEDIYYLLDERAMVFFETNYNNSELVTLESGSIAIVQKNWDKIYKKGMDPMREYIKSNMPALLKQVNNNLSSAMWEKYATGTISKWEMDSVSYYHHQHELDGVDYWKHKIERFSSNSEEPEVSRIATMKGRPVPYFRLWRIAGTVLDKDKDKKIVSILTPDNEVVNIRIWQSQFVKYDQQISTRLANGKKKVIEKSWFTRGNKILVSGIRRGDNFIPKIYKRDQTEFVYPIELILGMSESGELILQGDRAG